MSDNLYEAYRSIYEETPPANPPKKPEEASKPEPMTAAGNSVSELENLRKAAAQATMAGPSKEAQALMSDRTKTILGKETLEAGVKSQQDVEKMKTDMGKPAAAKPTPTGSGTVLAKKNGVEGKLNKATGEFTAGAFSKDEGERYNKLSGATTQPTPPVTSKPSRYGDKEFKTAWDYRNNPVAKPRIKQTWQGMTPEERKAAKDWATKNKLDWKEMGLQDHYQLLSHLINEGYANDEKSAENIIRNMSEKWRENILGL